MINLNKNFLIYGYGVSGKSVSKYLSNKNCKYSIFDDFKKLTKVKNVISKVILEEKLKFFDHIVISPSIKIDKKHILYNYKKKIIIDLDFLSNELSNQLVIGVTGTEGKSTTCLYLYQALSTKYNCTIIGNFGTTILDQKNLKKNLGKLEIIIIELSSYQLNKIKYLQLSHAVITNIYPDHLSYHENFTEYIKSKFSIGKLLDNKGYLILNNEVLSKYSSYLKSVNKLQILNVNIIKNRRKKLEDSIQDLNIQLIEKITKKIDKKINLNDLKFKTLPFRNQLIKESKHLRIYNDSKCTNLENASFKNDLIYSRNKILILGGRPKIQNKKIIVKNTLVLIYGPYSKKIPQNIIFQNCKYFKFMSLSNLLNFIKIINRNNIFDNILFSPGGESFDLYKDFMERGVIFNSLIKKIKI